jgi:hypothetical protein
MLALEALGRAAHFMVNQGPNRSTDQANYGKASVLLIQPQRVQAESHSDEATHPAQAEGCTLICSRFLVVPAFCL